MVDWRNLYNSVSKINNMDGKSESLEHKVEKRDWKQWLPGYGVYQVLKDDDLGKPTILADVTNEGVTQIKPLVYYGTAAYQSIFIGVGLYGAVYGLSQLAEKLF